MKLIRLFSKIEFTIERMITGVNKKTITGIFFGILNKKRLRKTDDIIEASKI